MGKKGHNKTPKQAFTPLTAKVPREGSRPNVGSQKFSWDTRSVDIDGRWGWRSVNADALLNEIIPKLQDFESMTWSEVDGPSGSHFVSIDACHPDAGARLKELGMEDVEELFSLRISGKKRIWGRREQARLKVLWWDPEHEVCPSPKKHT